MTLLGERIRRARKARGFTQPDLASAVGITKSAISQWETGTTKSMDSTKLFAIAKKLKVNPDWLSNGIGEMELQTVGAILEPVTSKLKELETVIPVLYEPKPFYTDEVRKTSIIEWDNVDDLPTDSHALVSRVRVKLSAGDGEYTTEEEAGEPLAFSKNWLISKNVTRNSNLVLVTATGTSMEPMIRDGSMLLVDTGQKEIIDGKVYAIRYGNDLRVKRLFKRFDNGLTIRSDNPDYPDEELSPNDMNDHIFAIGLVLWQAGDVF